MDQNDLQPANTPQTPDAPRRPRRLARKLALLGISFLFCALLLEIGVRILYRPPVFAIHSKSYLVEPWPYTFRMMPSQPIFVPLPEMDGGGFSFESNFYGFRGPNIYEIAARQIRIASIGDSFTLGWGLQDLNDQCVVGFVNDYKAAHPSRDIGVAVLADAGWAPPDYVYAYRDFATRMCPHLVVVGFFCGDDIVSEGALEIMSKTNPPTRIPIPPPPFFRIATLDWARTMVRGSPALTKLALAMGIRPSGELMRFMRADPPPMPARWADTLQILGDLHDRVRADGAHLAIVSYPSLIQVFAHRQLDDERFDYRKVDARLEAFCNERGITFVPFLPALIADGKTDLFYERDRHLTPRGQNVCRKVLFEKLKPVLDDVIANRSR